MATVIGGGEAMKVNVRADREVQAHVAMIRRHLRERGRRGYGASVSAAVRLALRWAARRLGRRKGSDDAK